MAGVVQTRFLVIGTLHFFLVYFSLTILGLGVGQLWRASCSLGCSSSNSYFQISMLSMKICNGCETKFVGPSTCLCSPNVVEGLVEGKDGSCRDLRLLSLSLQWRCLGACGGNRRCGSDPYATRFNIPLSKFVARPCLVLTPNDRMVAVTHGSSM